MLEATEKIQEQEKQKFIEVLSSQEQDIINCSSAEDQVEKKQPD